MKIISGTKTSEDVNRIQENQERSCPPNSKQRNGKNDKNDKSRKSCLFCGGIHQFEKGKCPVWDHKCRQCGGRNHFASKCKKSGKRVNNISSTDSPSSSVDDNEDIKYIAGIAVECANICSVESSDKSWEIYPEMMIDDKPFKVQVDCGLLINILPKDVTGNVQLSTHFKNPRHVEQNGSHSTRIVITNPQNHKKYSVAMEFIVVTEKLTPLIGARAAQHMKLPTIH